jgi:hypothetical protein
MAPRADEKHPCLGLFDQPEDNYFRLIRCDAGWVGSFGIE